MKKIFVFTALFTSLLLWAEQFTIVLPQKSAVVEKTAATELAEQLKKVATVKIVSENTPVQGKAIYVGTTALAKKAGKTRKYGIEQWEITGLDSNTLLINGGHRGVIYGAFEFLERFAGVMFLDEFSVYGPEKAPVWQKGTSVAGQPSFANRCTYSYFNTTKQQRHLFNMRQRQNFFLNEKLDSFKKSYGLTPVFGRPRANHTYHNYTANWPKDVPQEYFALDARTGKRPRSINNHGPGQVCLSHPEVRKLFAAQLRKYIEQDFAEHKTYPQYYAISANDNWYPCQCKMCLANVKKMGNYTDLTLDFINSIARTIQKDYPQVIVTFSAYLITQYPPKTVKFEKNVRIRIAQMGSEWSNNSNRVVRDCLRPLSHPSNAAARKELLDWRKHSKLSLWDYFISYRDTGYLTEISSVVGENLKFYHQFATDVFGEIEEPLGVSFHALRMFIVQRLTNDVTLDVAKETARFMKAYYGDAAAEMEAIRQLIIKENASVKTHLTAPLIQRKNLNAAYFAAAEKLFNVALAKTKGDKIITNRILRERIQFDRVRMMLSIPDSVAPGRKAAAERCVKDFAAIAPKFLYPARYQEALMKFKKEISGVMISTDPIPELPGREVVGYFRANSFHEQYKAKIMIDPDAPTGVAMTRIDGEAVDKGVTFGFNDKIRRKSRGLTVPAHRFRFDGKYHWYILGEVTLSKDCYAYAHRSWEIQRQLEDLLGIVPGNKVELAFYLKAELDEKDPKMVKRLYVGGVAALKPLPAGKKARIINYNPDLKKHFPGRQIINAYTGYDLRAQYRAKKVDDPEAVDKCALRLTVNDPFKQGVRYGYYDIVNKGNHRYTLHGKKLLLDNKYHWYSLGKVKISGKGYAHVHVSCELQRVLNEWQGCEGELMFRIKIEPGDKELKTIKNIYLDTIALLKPAK